MALWISDRITSDRRHRSKSIRVVLPVRCRGLFGQPEVVSVLQDLLWQYTEDEWKIVFTDRFGSGRSVELQCTLPFPPMMSSDCEVALWSGGLDALAGLASQIQRRSASHFILVGTGASGHMLHLQRQLHVGLKLPSGITSELFPIPIRLNNIAGMGKNRWQRARALSFQLIGAAVAIHAGESKLHMYENGVGAINLPFRACEVGLDHARSVHPVALHRTERFVSLVLGRRFEIVNPFLFVTKAEMCKTLRLLGWEQLVPQSSSCDRRQRKRPSQCGSCSSCLLRRQAPLAAGIPDETSYVSRGLGGQGSHLFAMRIQTGNLAQAFGTSDPWGSLTQAFPDLGEIAGRAGSALSLSRADLSSSLVDLYRRYVAEWERTRFGNGEL